MTHRNDRRIIEESIPPQLIRYLLECALNPEEEDDEYRELYDAILSACSDTLRDVHGKHREVLLRRLERIMKGASVWLKTNGIDSRKALAMAHDWVVALHDTGMVEITHEGFITVLERLAEVFREAPKVVDGWEKIEKSALKAGYKFHAFFEKEGYYK
mgnify:CR=1 FL=1